MPIFEEIHVYDFDGTLFQTPDPLDYKKTFGKKFVNSNWWENPISLSPPMKIIPNQEIIDEFHKSIKNPLCLSIVMTGRMEHLRPQIQTILNQHNIRPNELILSDRMNVLEFKTEKLKEFINKHPHIRKIQMFDDDIKKSCAYEKLGEQLGVPISVRLCYDERSLKKYLDEISKSKP